MTDFFSKFFKKEKKRKQLEENVAKGKIAEEMYEADAAMSGINYKRTGKGSDYEETHRDPLTGKKSKRLVEVKSDGAPLTKLQKKTKKRKSKNYVVKRYDTSLATGKAFSAENIFNISTKKKKKKTKTKKRKSKSKKTDDFGFNSDNVFGGSW